MTPNPADVRAALAELGDNADQVAERLLHLDAAGKVNDPCGCPVARYVLMRFPTLTKVHVGNDDLCLNPTQHCTDILYDSCPDCGIWLPDAVKAFIDRFDRNDGAAYPHLVRP